MPIGILKYPLRRKTLPYGNILWLPFKNIWLSRHVYTAGDSLTEGGYYQTMLSSLLGSDYAMTNVGLSGRTTAQILANFNSEVISPGNATHIIIWGGINDILQDVDAVDMETNLQSMYTAAKNAGIRVIACNITPFKGHVDWTAGRQTALDAVNTWMANTAVNIDTRIDLYSLLEGDPDTLNPTYEYADHLHLNGTGQNLVGTTIFNSNGVSGQLSLPDGLKVTPKGCSHAAAGYSFDGSNDLINTGADHIGLAAITVLVWIYLNGWGGNNLGRIFDNGKAVANVNMNNTNFTFSSDNSHSSATAVASMALSKWYRLAITRTGAGTANLYINGSRNGTANQDSGTPIAGTSNLIIGNQNAAARAFNGVQDNFQLFNRVFSPAEIMADFIANRSEHL